MRKPEKIRAEDVLKDLMLLKNKSRAGIRACFFRAYKGGYGQGDVFLGLTVPQQRKIAGKYYKEISLEETEKLLKNKFHEARYAALSVLKAKYMRKKTSSKEKEKIAGIYLRNIAMVNNWDLVDISAPYISGEHWYAGKTDGLRKMAQSKCLWRERIAVLSCFYFIRRGSFKEIFALSELFLHHQHDLIRKAVGWMLRETGKRNAEVLYGFLDKNYKNMPATMLRYALEKLPEKKRRLYMER